MAVHEGLRAFQKSRMRWPSCMNAEQLHLTNLIKALYHNGGTKMDCKSFVGIVARAELHRLVDIVVQLLPRDIAAGTRHANLNKEV